VAALRIVAPGFADLQALLRPDRPLEAGPPLDERSRGEILAAGLEEVEDAVDDRELPHQRPRWFGDPEALLQTAEGRLLTVKRHHLAVVQKLSGRWAAIAARTSG
jgi:hypothetical protein